MALERLQKILARAGVVSRRGAEHLMLEGRVTVNGKVAQKLGMRADANVDHIKVDGKLIPSRTGPKHYFLAFKPQKVITSLADPEGRPTVADLLHANKIRVRVFPVGRLDWDADGLLLFTNDGELANQVMHPRTHLPKVYRIKVKGHPSEETLRRVRRGIMIGPRIRTLPATVMKEQETDGFTWFKVTVVEGRQNQIKKMFARIGYPVCSIRRVAIGPLHLGRLRVGEVRALTSEELAKLQKALRMVKQSQSS